MGAWHWPDFNVADSFITLGAGLLLDGVVQVDMAWVGGAFTQVEKIEGTIEENHDLKRFVLGLGYRF